MTGARLFDRGSLVHVLVGLALGIALVPWWVALLLAMLGQVATSAIKGMMSKTEPAWPHRNHVLLDIVLLMAGWAFGFWLHPIDY